jgi:Cys-rich protein (TIGR01571 family)
MYTIVKRHSKLSVQINPQNTATIFLHKSSVRSSFQSCQFVIRCLRTTARRGRTATMTATSASVPSISHSSWYLLSLRFGRQQHVRTEYSRFLTPVNEDSRCLYTICMPSPFWTRRLIRMKYEFPAQDCRDCFCICCCAPCNICQDARELKARGDAYNVIWTTE